MSLKEVFDRAAEELQQAETLMIHAGAGMGVDSGLPDFRGTTGFWKAYPLYEKLGLNFIEAANPRHFSRDPAFGWGFYGHRTALYRETSPHQGFQLLLNWIKALGLDYMVVTSNVDGQFQKAGFDEDRIYEVHGSLNYLQCTNVCRDSIWPNTEEIPVDLETMRARKVPQCPYCGAAARPNVLMFGDFSWVEKRAVEQENRFRRFLSRYRESKIFVIELGAGTAVPTIRNLSENIIRHYRGVLVRINPREYNVPPSQISIPCSALEGLQGIDNSLDKLRPEQ